MLTKQEIFDKAVGGVINQGRLAQTFDGCYYLSHDGKSRCAIGWLVDEETARGWTDDVCEQSPCLTGLTDTHGEDAVLSALEANGIPRDGHTFNWLLALQNVHDSVSTLEGFEAAAKRFAEASNLQFNF